MEQRDPITMLLDDHRLIEKVLQALDERLADPSGEFPADFVEQAIDFIVHFADGCHHYCEEEALFPALAKLGVAVEGGPIGVMLHEHSVGRACVAGMRENLPAARSGDPGARIRVREYAAEFTNVLRNHIWKEDNILFQMARNVLSDEGSRTLAAQFTDEHNPRVKSELRARYAAFANSL